MGIMARRAKNLQLILASASPRRRQLLAEAGYQFEVVAPEIPEPDESLKKLPAGQQAEALAYFKARAIADVHRDACVLAADTLVSVAGSILGKPASRGEAEQMLRTISGTRHEVITGVALVWPGGRLIASDSTHVTMRTIRDTEIEQYLDLGEWRGKAGAYAIQETADRFVQAVHGSFSNVVGLPMELLERMLERLGLAASLKGK